MGCLCLAGMKSITFIPELKKIYLFYGGSRRWRRLEPAQRQQVNSILAPQRKDNFLFSSFFNQINQIHQSPPSWRVRLIGLMVAFFSSFVCWLWAGRSSPAERKKINQFQQLISFLFPWAVNLIEEKRSKDWFIDLLVKDGWLIEVSWMNGLLGPKTHNQQPAIHKENFSFLWNEGAANKLIHSTNSINQN